MQALILARAALFLWGVVLVWLSVRSVRSSGSLVLHLPCLFDVTIAAQAQDSL